MNSTVYKLKSVDIQAAHFKTIDQKMTTLWL